MLRRPGTLALLLALACAQPPDLDAAWTGSDSAGIRLLSGPLPGVHWQLGTVPETKIGAVEGDSTQLLVNVVHAEALDDGRVVIVDAGPRRILVYAPDGTRVSALGGAGDGPGEFGSIESARVSGDGTVVYDRRNRRLTWHSLSDGRVRDRVLPEVAGEVRILGEVGGGRVLLEVTESHPDLTVGGYSVTRDTLMLLAVAPAGATDTVLRVPGTQALYWLAGSGSYIATMELPFGARVAAALTDSGVVVADGVRRGVEIRSATGALRAISRVRPDEVRTVSDADVERYVDHAVERLPGSTGVDPAIRRQNIREQVDMLPAGHAIPAFDRILADGANVWVRDYVRPWEEDAPQLWTVFDEDGRAAARVTTPSGVTVTHIASDRITGIARGEFDEQYVVVYDLLRRP